MPPCKNPQATSLAVPTPTAASPLSARFRAAFASTPKASPATSSRSPPTKPSISNAPAFPSRSPSPPIANPSARWKAPSPHAPSANAAQHHRRPLARRPGAPASRRRDVSPLQLARRQSHLAGHQRARPRLHLRQPHPRHPGRRAPQRPHRRMDSLGGAARARHPERRTRPRRRQRSLRLERHRRRAQHDHRPSHHRPARTPLQLRRRRHLRRQRSRLSEARPLGHCSPPAAPSAPTATFRRRPFSAAPSTSPQTCTARTASLSPTSPAARSASSFVAAA